ncbi:MAG TPA: ThuA domain-containing protein [Verrucomicrobiae bacterium]|nr:ThuA domain-containing protein [Verrucomicrobiae bacterium]
MKRLAALFIALLACASASAAQKHIIFIAGKPSHGPGEHEFRAGCLLLKSCLDKVPGVSSVVYSNGWPEESAALSGADSIVLYMDGGPGHAAIQDDRLATLGALMKKGVGLVCLHYATEPTPAKGEREFLEWIGGAFEPNWSVNPVWDAHFVHLSGHPITRGVKPFHINDEWYFHLRFLDHMEGVTPILFAIPPESTMSRPDGPHEGNPAVREAVKRGELETVAWTRQRVDGGRGFGFTGAHFHKNWANPNFRKLVLNGIVWTAKMEVPDDGIQSTVTADELEKNLDPKGRR